MAAPPKVSTQAIVNALLLWRGDVSAVARCLGLSRNGLYQRIQRLGLDLPAFRNASGGGNVVTPINIDTEVSTLRTASSMPTRSGHAQAIQKSARANFPDSAEKRRLGVVQQGATATAVDEVPIKTTPPRRLPPLRLRPDLREKLQRAAWQLQARYQVATDDNLILEQLVEEMLDSWVRTKLEPAPVSKAKTKKAEKNGNESE